MILERIALIALAVALLGSGVMHVKQAGKLSALRVTLAEERASRAEENRLQAMAYAAESDKARKATETLQHLMNRSLEERDAQVQSALLAAGDLRRRLLAAPAPAASPAASAPGPASGAPAFAAGSLGAQLRGTAEPLVGEAERAERIRLNLLLCYATYDKARATLKGDAP